MPAENYVYEALQGAMVQAVLLTRAGYDAFNWENQALLRAFLFEMNVVGYLAEGDDTWMPHLVIYFYGPVLPASEEHARERTSGGRTGRTAARAGVVEGSPSRRWPLVVTLLLATATCAAAPRARAISVGRRRSR